MTQQHLHRRGFLAAAAAGVSLTVSARALAQIARTTVPIPAPSFGVSLPDTPLAQAATILVKSAMPPFLFNHCMRTYVFGALLAKRQNIRFDEEMIYVAAAMHDLGLVDAYASKDLPFEMDGADAAKAFLERQGVKGARAELVWNAIAMHATKLINHQPPEVGLVGLGAGVDVFGGGLGDLPKETVAALLAVYPRLKFNDAFQDLLTGYCLKKPYAQMGTWTDDYCRRHNHDVVLPTIDGRFAKSPFAE